jgi:integrase
MYSKTPSGKSPKGSVQVVNSHDRLQLRFRFGGKRHCLSLGFSDSLSNRKLAEMRAKEIELDILSGHFDQTLERYKPVSALSTVPDIKTPPESKFCVAPKDLWEQYTQYRAAGLKETTRHYHASFTRLFAQVGEVPVMDALRVKAALEKVTTIYQTKRALGQLASACRWGKKHNLVEANPYEGMSNEMPKYRYQLEPKPNAFSEEEREQVLEAFRKDERPGMTYL